jgi:hypothetical protein
VKYVLSVLVLTFISVTPLALAQDSCEQTTFGKCFTIHARFAVYTGDGMETLWPVGSHRLLSVAAGKDRLYKMLGDRPSDYFIFGDFVVCPLEKDIPGHMRRVCIKEMRNLKRLKRREP